MSSKANSAAIRRRVGASAVSNITAPTAPTAPTATSAASNPSTDRVHIGDLIVSHDRALAELRRTVAEHAEQISVLTGIVQKLTDGSTVEVSNGDRE